MRRASPVLSVEGDPLDLLPIDLRQERLEPETLVLLAVVGGDHSLNQEERYEHAQPYQTHPAQRPIGASVDLPAAEGPVFCDETRCSDRATARDQQQPECAGHLRRVEGRKGR